jgi:hypothetical protein
MNSWCVVGNRIPTKMLSSASRHAECQVHERPVYCIVPVLYMMNDENFAFRERAQRRASLRINTTGMATRILVQ